MLAAIVGIGGIHGFLQVDGAGDGVNGAGELNEDAVPHQLDDAAVMLRKQRLEDSVRRDFQSSKVPASSGWMRRL